jgi:hypothetical protein
MSSDLVWAMEWLNSLCDDLNTGRESEHPRSREFLDELATRRISNHGLHAAAKEAKL